MFALAAARDLVIAIVVVVILVAAMNGLQRREARLAPAIHSTDLYRVPVSENCGTLHCRTAFHPAENRR